MKITQRFDYDVVIMGAGLTGMSAAVKMAEDNPHLKVAIISKVHPVRSHSGAAQGGINAAVAREDSWQDHYYETLKGGWFLGDQDAVKVLCEEAPAAIYELDRWGASFNRDSAGRYAQRPFGGQRRNRTCYVQDITGHALLTTLFEQTIAKGIEIFWEWFVFDIISDGQDFYGFLAFDLKSGEIAFFRAGAGLVATGGAGRVFGQSSNALINTGDGMAMAWRAGVPLKDMEFFQIHPTGLFNGILITEGARGEGGYLVNNRGERFMERYAPQFMELAPRDLVARSIHTEIVEGRGFADGCVRLDLCHLGREKLTRKLPQILEITKQFAGVDAIKEAIPVRPTVHYSMGGIHVDTDCATPLNGLFAAGEAACVSVHGANRLGGNSLLETVVFGCQAAIAIAAAANCRKKVPEALLDTAMAGFCRIFAGSSSENAVELRSAMEQAMVHGLGIKRDQAGMEQGLAEISALRERFSGVRVANQKLVFNVELYRALELGCMLDLAYACALASCRRQESRGSHFHLDFPAMDNQHFLKHSLVTLKADGRVDLDYLDVRQVDTEPLSKITY